MTHAALQQDAATDAKTYGPGFWQAFQAVHAPDGDPRKITDPAQLYLRAGPDGDLTAAGVNRLAAEIQSKATPEGEAESAMKKAFLEYARGQITGSIEGLHISDPKGDALYLRFLAQALPAFDAGKQAGKSAVQLLDPDSPDYLGKSIALFQRPPALYSPLRPAQRGPVESEPLPPPPDPLLPDGAPLHGHPEDQPPGSRFEDQDSAIGDQKILNSHVPDPSIDPRMEKNYLPSDDSDPRNHWTSVPPSTTHPTGGRR
jgi:hypothetical protein